MGLGLTDSSVVSPAPVPDSAMATSAASLLQAAISSVLPASTTREVHESSEKGAPTGAEKAAASGRDAMLLLEGPKILPCEPKLTSSLHFDSFPFAFVTCLDRAIGTEDQPSAPEEQQITGAESGMDMGHLPIAEEVPVENFPLSTDKIKSAQEKLSEC